MSRHPITFDEYAGLLNGRIATIHYERASVVVQGAGDDKQFVMEGPSGSHKLLCIATDHDRLNAHWANFATHPTNKRA